MLTRYFVILLTSLSFMVSTAQAQTDQGAAGATQSSTADNTWNVSLNPGGTLILALIGGFSIGGAVDYKVNPNWTVGLTAGFLNWNFSTSSVTSNNSSNAVEAGVSFFQVGARAQYFVEKAFTDSWYFAPQINFQTGTATTSQSLEVGLSLLSFGGTAGYMWIWDSGFNIQLGIGAGYAVGLGDVETTDSDVLNASDGGFTVLGDLSLGFTF